MREDEKNWSVLYPGTQTRAFLSFLSLSHLTPPRHMPAIHTAALALAAAVLIAALAGVTWDGDIVWEPVVRDATPTAAEGPRDTPVYSRETLTFPLHGGARGRERGREGEGERGVWQAAGWRGAVGRPQLAAHAKLKGASARACAAGGGG